jgi:hypothetical protein
VANSIQKLCPTGASAGVVDVDNRSFHLSGINELKSLLTVKSDHPVASFAYHLRFTDVQILEFRKNEIILVVMERRGLCSFFLCAMSRPFPLPTL